MIKCRICGELKEQAHGTSLKEFGTFFDLELTVRRPICEECRDSIMKAFFDVGSKIAWNK